MAQSYLLDFCAVPDPQSPRPGKPVLRRSKPFRSLQEIFADAWNYFDESEGMYFNSVSFAILEPVLTSPRFFVAEREANNVSSSVSLAMQKGMPVLP